MREDASWKNDYRYWYLVYKGKLYYLADARNLSGELTMEEMLSALGVKLEEANEEETEKSEVGG